MAESIDNEAIAHVPHGADVAKSTYAQDTTEFVRNTRSAWVFTHLSYLSCFGKLAGQQRGLRLHAEMLNVGSIFHGLGSMPRSYTKGELARQFPPHRAGERQRGHPGKTGTNCRSNPTPPRSFICFVLLILIGLSPAVAQQPEELEQQLQQLKQQYQASTQDLERRIDALEQQIDDEKAAKEKAAKGQPKEGTASAAQLAVEQAGKGAVLGQSDQVGAKFQGDIPSEPTYDLLQEADTKIAKLQQQVGLFEYHGYLRSVYGLNGVGGQQVAFEAPGADAKYRLGNEAETYGEFIFVNNWLNPDEGRDKAWLRTEVMIEANTSNSENYANFPNGIGGDQFRLREAFVQAGNVLGDWQPNAKFWAGERYYRRQHIDIDDFYPLDMSGYGAGVEDFNVGIGKVAAAFISAARPDIVTQNGILAKSNIDVRLYDLSAPAGLWAVWFDYATSKGGATSRGTIVPTTDGYAFGFRHQRLEWHGGYHTFSSCMEPERPAISAVVEAARRSPILPFTSINQDSFSSQNSWFFNRMTDSELCQSSSTSAPKTETRKTVGIIGCRSAPAQKYVSQIISRSRSKPDSTRRTAAYISITDGYTRSPYPPKSEQDASSSAGQYWEYFLLTLAGRRGSAARWRRAISEQNEWVDLRRADGDVVVVRGPMRAAPAEELGTFIENRFED